MKDWTIMVYLAGDNDLSEDMAKRLIDMRSIFDDKENKAKTDRVELLVFYDGDNPMIRKKLFNLTKGINGISVKDPSIFNSSGDKQTVYNFVKWCIKEQKAVADNYALVLSGHGDGFQQATFLRDSSSSQFVTVKDLKGILKKINVEILKKKKLNVLCFDSCVMNTIEIANEFKEVAEVMIGSQGYMPSTGLSYQKIVDGLVAFSSNSPITKEDIASVFANAATQANRQFSELTLRSLDMSVINLDEAIIDSAIKSINDLAAILEKSLPAEPTPESKFLTKESLKKALLSSHWKCQTYLYDQSVDIIDFCESLRYECLLVVREFGMAIENSRAGVLNASGSKTENTSEVNFTENMSKEDKRRIENILPAIKTMKDIVAACDEVIGKFGDCVTDCCFSGPDYQYSTGLSVFFPWSLHTYEITKPKFLALGFASSNTKSGKTNKWYSFLKRYLEETLRRPRVSLVEKLKTGDKNFFRAGKVMLDPPAKGMLDPPAKGMLISENRYKEYFGRTKNFPLNDISDCSK